MLLFDTGKKLEKAVGEEAASIIIHVFEQYDEQTKKELATKGDMREETNALRADVRETELRLQAEIEKVRAEIEKIRAEIQKSKLESIRWMIGGWLGLAAIMAKGFGWLGF